MAHLEILDRDTLDEFLASPYAVLILAKTDCAACAAWSAELGESLEGLAADDQLNSVRFGKLVLNQPGLGGFKRSSPWLKDVNDLPFTALYSDNEYRRGFIGSGWQRLVNRLNRVLA